MAHHHLCPHSQRHNHQHLTSVQPSSSVSGSQPSLTPSQLSSSSSLTSTTLPDSPKRIFANHYQTLISGDPIRLKSYLENDSDFPYRVWELDNSTVLHIAAIAGQVDAIFSIASDHPQLLFSSNNRGDLPVHLATRAGHRFAVMRLVDCAKSQQSHSVCNMLEAKNGDQNTALHVALENQQLKLATDLFKNCQHTFYCKNEQGISPLYLAIKAGFWDLVGEMLKRPSSDAENDHPSSDAENELCSTDKSVVHAVIMAKKTDVFKIMTRDWFELIIGSLDERGRRPLSYAAYIGFLEGVSHIMDDPNLSNSAFKHDEDGSFPIHRACSGGHIRIVKKLIHHSPDMKWLINGEGQSILHVAAASGKVEVVEYLLKQSELESLINMKDYDAHTPLHLATMSKKPTVVYALTWDDRVTLHAQDKHGFTALDLAEDYADIPSFQERLTWLALRHAGVPKAPLNIEVQKIEDVNAPNANHSEHVNEEMKMFAIIQHNKRKKNKYKDRLNTLLMVSTLVATVTFASGFTVPGGYNQEGSDKGMAVLAHKCAFQVFVITNTLALYSSILAVVTLIWAHLDDLRLILLSLDIALPLLGISLTMLSVAFMSGLFVVLVTRPWLGLLVMIMGLVFLGALFVIFIPLYSPTSRIKYKAFRWVLNVPFKLMLLACDRRDGSETLY